MATSMILRCIDAETCGLPPDDGQVVEIGWTDLELNDNGTWYVGAPQSMLVNPARSIPPTASAIHHLTDDDVKSALPLNDATIAADLVRDDIFAYIAHKASFEQSVIPLGAVRWICSWKVAMRLAPSAPSHSLQALRYYLKLDVDRSLASPPHRAGPDTYIDAHLMARALTKMTPEQMIEISNSPALLPRIPFGKHKGQAWSQIPDDYLEWCLKQKDLDPDVLFTAKHHLRTRVF